MIRTAPSVEHRTKPPKTFVPPFATGDKLDRATFHALYLQTPKNFKAELISGVVYVASPVLHDHCEPHFRITHWLGLYLDSTPEILGHSNGSLLTDTDIELQPDLMAFRSSEAGGKVEVNAKGYMEGIPDLVIEVSNSSRNHDLVEKKASYETIGVPEYLILDVVYETVHAFRRTTRGLQPMTWVDQVWKSHVFPGLWLDVPAFFGKDSVQVRATLALGLATPEHAAFVAKLQAKAKKPKGKKR
jgi:Uma2 family endonuclease